MKKTQKGFTLVELLVVIAILAILSTVAVVGYTSFIDKANKTTVETEAAKVDSLIEAALAVNDNAKIEDGLWVVKGIDGYTTETTEPTTGTTVDLSTDLAAFADKLGDVSGKLVYDDGKYTVDVDTHTGATKK